MPEAMITRQILEALNQAADVELDELVSSLPALGWNEIFLEVDRLSRTGAVCVRSRAGIYWVSLPGRECRPQ